MSVIPQPAPTLSQEAERIDLLGVAIDRLDMDATVARCEQLIDAGDYSQQVSINTAKIVSLQHDRDLQRAVNACQLINADGQGIVWASRVLGCPLPERVAGIDLMHRLLELAEHRGYRVYVLGARAEVLEQAIASLRERHPALTFAGYRDGYFADDEVDTVCEEIRATRADILFVAMTSPRKELFLNERGPTLGVALGMGVGGSIDVVAGITKRAPRLVQRLGLEWAFRMLQEPRRLAGRYIGTNSRFVVLLGRELLGRVSRAGQSG